METSTALIASRSHAERPDIDWPWRCPQPPAQPPLPNGGFGAADGPRNVLATSAVTTIAPPAGHRVVEWLTGISHYYLTVADRIATPAAGPLTASAAVRIRSDRIWCKKRQQFGDRAANICFGRIAHPTWSTSDRSGNSVSAACASIGSRNSVLCPTLQPLPSRRVSCSIPSMPSAATTRPRPRPSPASALTMLALYGSVVIV
jgi:hypothetical protein